MWQIYTWVVSYELVFVLSRLWGNSFAWVSSCWPISSWIIWIVFPWRLPLQHPRPARLHHRWPGLADLSGRRSKKGRLLSRRSWLKQRGILTGLRLHSEVADDDHWLSVCASLTPLGIWIIFSSVLPFITPAHPFLCISAGKDDWQ